MGKSRIRKFDLLKFTANLAENESDRTWNRTSVMLSVISGFTALIAILEDRLSPLIITIGSVFGLALSIIWYKMIVISKFYVTRWHKDMLAIIDSDETLMEYVRGLSRTRSRVERPTNLSATSFMKIVAVLFCLVWLGFLSYGILSLFGYQ